MPKILRKLLACKLSKRLRSDMLKQAVSSPYTSFAISLVESQHFPHVCSGGRKSHSPKFVEVRARLAVPMSKLRRVPAMTGEMATYVLHVVLLLHQPTLGLLGALGRSTHSASSLARLSLSLYSPPCGADTK